MIVTIIQQYYDCFLRRISIGFLGEMNIFYQMQSNVNLYMENEQYNSNKKKQNL